ncbi:hypothetical protein [Streptomyces sp. NPDC056160]|uniref:hypothetical protein n=1 Tax=Streptomyces sp. NPDC056160 TaxID=3345731 RepID=UPI0035D5F331
MEPPALHPLRGVTRCAVAALALAGGAWIAGGVWQIRLARAGQPLSGPPDQTESWMRAVMFGKHAEFVFQDKGPGDHDTHGDWAPVRSVTNC